MPTGSFADRVRRWERLAQTLTANAPDLPGVADNIKELQDLLQRTKDLQQVEDASQAHFRDTITQRQALDKEGEDLRIRIMLSLKGKYGFRADKLYEFGLRPARLRRSKKTPQIGPPPGPGAVPQATPSPEVPASTAAPLRPTEPRPLGFTAEPPEK